MIFIKKNYQINLIKKYLPLIIFNNQLSNSSKRISQCFLCFLLFFFANNNLAFGDDNYPKNLQNFVDPCKNTAIYHQAIISEVQNGNSNTLADLPDCFKNDRKLFMQLVMIDYNLFAEASFELQQDFNFIKRLVKINPKIIQLCAPEVRKDPYFMEEMTYINRDALRFAGWSLLDDKPFMTKMIDYDSQNYQYASDRIRSIPEIAQMAIRDNGLMLKYAPFTLKNDEEIVKKAIDADISSLQFASKKLREKPELIALAQDDNKKINIEKINDFIKKHYLEKNDKKNLEDIIVNQGKFHQKRILINHNYLTKWQKRFGEVDPVFHNYKEEWRLISVDSRNYQTNFKEDLKAYPKLVNKIVKFLKKHRIDDNTIDNLKTTFLWKISDKPLTLAFNLYFLRDSSDADLGASFANITSLTAIVRDTSKPIVSNNKKQDKTKNIKDDKNTQQLTTSANDTDNSLENNLNQDDEILDLEAQEEEEIILSDEENQEDEEDKKDIKKDAKKTKKKNTQKTKENKKSKEKIKAKNTKNKILESENANWNLSVIETIFDSETKLSETYKNGHKRYILWDLFKLDRKDKNPLLIFVVEDEFKNYFEIYAPQKNQKYKLLLKP